MGCIWAGLSGGQWSSGLGIEAPASPEQRGGPCGCARGGVCYNRPRREGLQSCLCLKGAIPLAIMRQGAAVCLLAVAFILLISGCSQQPVAIVNGKKISRAEFIDRLKQVAGEQVLTDLIYRRLIEDAFARAGLTVSDQEVEERLKELMGNFPSPQAFQEWLTARGLTVDEVKKQIEFELKLEKLRSKDLKYTEEDLRRFFKKHRDRFRKPERVIISEIVVSSKQEADRIYKELQKPGANFAALARQYSISPMTRRWGGRRMEEPLDYLMPPEVRDVVRKMKVGEISKPIKAGDNWYIVKLESRKPPENPTFEQVKKEVERYYRLVNSPPPEQLLRELARQAVVQVLDPELASVQNQFMPRGELPTFGGEKKPQAGQAGGGKGGQQGQAGQKGQKGGR